MIQRCGERLDAVIGDCSECGLEPDHAAQRGGYPYRARGVGPDRERHHACSGGDGAAATRSAADPVGGSKDFGMRRALTGRRWRRTRTRAEHSCRRSPFPRPAADGHIRRSAAARCERTTDPDVVSCPATSTRSLTDTGMPCSGPRSYHVSALAVGIVGSGQRLLRRQRR